MYSPSIHVPVKHIILPQLTVGKPFPKKKTPARRLPKGALQKILQKGPTRLNAAPPYGAPLKGALPAERHARGPDGQGMRSPQPWALARPAPSTDGHAGAALARG